MRNVHISRAYDDMQDIVLDMSGLVFALALPERTQDSAIQLIEDTKVRILERFEHALSQLKS